MLTDKDRNSISYPACPWMSDNICVLNKCGLYVPVRDNEGACAFLIIGTKALADYMKINKGMSK